MPSPASAVICLLLALAMFVAAFVTIPRLAERLDQHHASLGALWARVDSLEARIDAP